MERHTPVPGEFYRHFKGNLYQVHCLAEHSESGEALVIYQALYGDYQIYARPLEQFMGQVDHTKYPQADALYRFTQVRLPAGDGSARQAQPALQAHAAAQEAPNASARQVPPTPQPHAAPAETRPGGKPSYDSEKTPEELFLLFLDAENSRAKLEVFALLRQHLTRRMADNLAASMDLSLPGNSIEEDAGLIEDQIRARAKFETRW